MGDSRVESMLRNNYWSTPRAKSPDPRKVADAPHRTTYAYRNDRTIPRRVPYDSGPPKPPPPSVEDENDALAKEAGSVVSSVPSEEPVNRGELDQYPILLPVEEHMYEHNLERRFVLVSKSSDVPGSEKKQGQRRMSTERFAEPDPEPVSYEANTGRKYGLPPDREENTNKAEARLEPEHPRNRPRDLPPIVTEAEGEGRSHNTRRSRSTTTGGRSDDHFSPHTSSASSRIPREHLLSPEVIEHATNGRDRGYYKGGSNLDPQARNRSAHPGDQYNRSPTNGRGYKERESKSTHSFGSAVHKRHTSELPPYARRRSRDRYESSRLDEPSSRSDRKVPSSMYSQSDYDSGSQHSSSARNTQVPPHYNDTFYSSEDEPRPRADHRRRISVMPVVNTGYLTTPVEPRGSGRRKSRGQSPSRSPRPSRISLSDAYSGSSSSRSSTFPKESALARDEDRDGRQFPRASTSRGAFTTARITIPAVTATTTTTGISSTPSQNVFTETHRSSAMPPPPPPRGSFVESRALPPTPSSAASAQPPWSPPRFEPPQNGGSPDTAPGGYRRYSAEVQSGWLPDIPPCPRTRPETGHMDWHTLPHCNTFNICPTCYNANFAATEFAGEFRLMAFRRGDDALACDFGASEFYRIAWLFTRKYLRPTLALLHGLTRIAAEREPCPGGRREASRLWYSIRDPATGRPVEGFAACDACAAAVEMLLPGLTGLFVPADAPAERARGVCSLSQHDHGRFLLYFDALEAAADRSLETRNPPDAQALVGRVRQLAAVPPCPGDRGPLAAGYWYTTPTPTTTTTTTTSSARSNSSSGDDVASIAICSECFLTFAQPLLDGADDPGAIGRFRYAPPPHSEEDGTTITSISTSTPAAAAAGCVLSSERMREFFRRAVARRDPSYLDAKVAERAQKRQEFDARMQAAQRRGLRTPRAEADEERAVREWQRYE
ncbi:putative proteinrelated to ser arg-related nuclear matrix [Rosellinia necatrix]|uniref:Ser arg-related nuclear matrix protein n=1 Tax=Rosellinia necatrix TaxID=77044 RepID=A0A1S7ULZ0_ROSNE|nr:putative proteinrelated to ser arg-related nuclear matrix [Rosellinia necatrix]